jgi:hypothetical protein
MRFSLIMHSMSELKPALPMQLSNFYEALPPSERNGISTRDTGYQPTLILRLQRRNKDISRDHAAS